MFIPRMVMMMIPCVFLPLVEWFVFTCEGRGWGANLTGWRVKLLNAYFVVSSYWILAWHGFALKFKREDADYS